MEIYHEWSLLQEHSKNPLNLKVICNEKYKNKHPSFLMLAMGTNMTESKNSLRKCEEKRYQFISSF
jgi:hypothetical protein